MGLTEKDGNKHSEAANKEVQPMAIGCVVMLQGLLMLLVLTTDGVLTIHTHLQLVTTPMQ